MIDFLLLQKNGIKNLAWHGVGLFFSIHCSALKMEKAMAESSADFTKTLITERHRG